MNKYVIDYSLKNGLGKPSISIYLTGCDNPIKCEDCHNYELQKELNYEYNINDLKQDINRNINFYLQFHDKLYISILGGEPLAKYNRKTTLEISKYIKEKHEDSTIILYSWRTIEQILKEHLQKYIKYIDYGVLGVYDKNLHIENVIPSSTNQYIYDFKNNTILKPIRLKKG